MGAFAFGAALGWSSPASSKLQEASEYPFKLNTNEFGWVSSIINLGCAISCIPVGALMNIFGRKSTMLGLIVPFTVGWALVIWAENFEMMMVGRFMLGIAGL